MHPFPVLCSSILVAETRATELDAHFKIGVKLSWTCWYKQAGQVLKVEGELHLTGIIRIPMKTACRHELTMLFYSEKWLCDNHTLLKTYSLFDFRCNFFWWESFAFLFLYVRTKQMLPRVVDEHTGISLTGQTINCRSSLQLFAIAYLGCNCKKIWHGEECRKC